MGEYLPRIEDTDLKRNPRTGYWEIHWTIPADKSPTGRARTRVRSCHTSDRTLAAEVRRTYLSASSQTAAVVGSLTVGDVIDLYQRDYMATHGTGAAQEFSLRQVKRLLGPEPVSGLSAKDVSAYRRVRAASVKSGTIRRELGALRAVLNWAQRNEHLPREFVQPHIELPPEGQARERYLDRAEEAAFHGFCERIVRDRRQMGRPVWRGALFALVALNTAARSEAIERLTWDRVNLAQKIMDFRDPGVRATKKRRVPVPVSDRLFRTLARVWIMQGRPQVGAVLGSFGSTRTQFDKLMAAWPGTKVGRHDLRRTWATLAAQRGVSMFDIAGVLGDTLPTVEKHYAHHSPGYLRDAINAR